MLKIRIAGSGEADSGGQQEMSRAKEIARQKEIWKLCFGDSGRFVDFYYGERYREEDTLFADVDDVLAAMLTMITVHLNIPGKKSQPATMLYAIATHPAYQGRGIASRLLEYAHQYLRQKNRPLTLLAPAEKRLFEFYRKLGYRDGFFLREALLRREELQGEELSGDDPQVDEACRIAVADAWAYNRKRTELLGLRMHIAYRDKEIDYQKRLSGFSGADLYLVKAQGKEGCAVEGCAVEGCAAAERINDERILVKELLMPTGKEKAALRQLARLLPAAEYVVRTPAFAGAALGGELRPQGMFRMAEDELILRENGGYLGLAFE